jgi:hypothetical protein
MHTLIKNLGFFQNSLSILVLILIHFIYVFVFLGRPSPTQAAQATQAEQCWRIERRLHCVGS